MNRQNAPGDLLLAVLSGERTQPLPVAPLYLSLFFAPHIDRLVAEAYREKMETLGVDQVEVDFDEFLNLRLKAKIELTERYLGNCSWLFLPVRLSRREIEGVRVRREGKKMLFLGPNGSGRDMLTFSQRSTEDVWEVPKQMRDPSSWEVVTAERLLVSETFLLARSLAEKYKGSYALYAGIGGPFWLCYSRLGFKGLMETVVEEPTLLKEMEEYNLASTLEVVSAFKALGAQVIFIEECLASADLISPGQFEGLVLPYEQRLLSAIHAEGLFSVFYFCGDVMPLVAMIKGLPWDAFAVEESKKGFEIEIGEVRKAVGDRRTLLANLDAVLVRDGRGEDILAEARRQFEVAGSGPFVISNGSPFTLDTPAGKVEFFCTLGELVS